MENNNVNEMPEVNMRIKRIIDERYGGNMSKFAREIGYGYSSKINRLFMATNNDGAYPYPTIDLIIRISEHEGCSTDYLLKGKEPKRHVNNIDINNSKNINGNQNVMGDGNSYGDNSGEDMNETIRILKSEVEKQSKTIETLLELLKNK